MILSFNHCIIIHYNIIKFYESFWIQTHYFCNCYASGHYILEGCIQVNYYAIQLLLVPPTPSLGGGLLYPLFRRCSTTSSSGAPTGLIKLSQELSFHFSSHTHYDALSKALPWSSCFFHVMPSTFSAHHNKCPENSLHPISTG